MKKMILIVGMLLIFPLFVHAQKLDIAFGMNRAPFVFNYQGEWQGIEVDILREALAFSGHEIASSIHVSNKRLVMAVPKMGLDAAVKVKSAQDGSFYSDVYLEHKNLVICRKDQQLSIKTLVDINKYSLAAWQNATQHLGEKFAFIVSPSQLHKNGGVYQEYASQKIQNVVFWHNRADLLIIDKHIFLWHKKQLAGEYQTNVELNYHDILPNKGKFKVSFKSSKIRDDFNRGLQNLHTTGKYQAIYDKYIK